MPTLPESFGKGDACALSFFRRRALDRLHCALYCHHLARQKALPLGVLGQFHPSRSSSSVTSRPERDRPRILAGTFLARLASSVCASTNFPGNFAAVSHSVGMLTGVSRSDERQRDATIAERIRPAAQIEPKIAPRKFQPFPPRGWRAEILDLRDRTAPPWTSTATLRRK